jgi:hypothetical protein
MDVPEIRRPDDAAALDTAVARAGEVCERVGVNLRDLARRVIDELRHGPWPSLDDVMVLLMGSPINGFACYGPLPDSDSISIDDTHELRHEPWWEARLNQLDLHPQRTLLYRVEVAMALLGDARGCDAADEHPWVADTLTKIRWQLRVLQLELR